MRARSSLTESQRERLVELFEQGYGCRAVSTQLGVGFDAARRLYNRYKLHGRLCLVEKPTKQSFSFAIKKEVVERHLAGETRMDLASKFGLSSEQLVGSWTRKYRKEGWDGLKPKPKGRPKGSRSAKPLTDVEKLKAENERLKAELDYIKKLRDLRNQGRA